MIILKLKLNYISKNYRSVAEYVHVSADGLRVLGTMSIVLSVDVVPHYGLVYDVQGAHVDGGNDVESLQEILGLNCDILLDFIKCVSGFLCNLVHFKMTKGNYNRTNPSGKR